MTKNEYIETRIVELEARRNYAAQLVMNRDMGHEVKMCELQIAALLKERDLVVLPAAPFEQLWRKEPQNYLMHTDNDGVDTMLCENHIFDNLTACPNCGPWPALLEQKKGV